jgi:hypothetical protein
MFKRNVILATFVVSSLFITTTNTWAQKQKTLQEVNNNVLFMTWNKTTPESEMNDDIKALKEHGVTIKYSNVKRNENGEITSIKVDFKDEEGNTGSTEYNGKQPISGIKFFKTSEGVGFGEAPRGTSSFPNMMWSGDDFPGMGLGLRDMPNMDMLKNQLEEHQFNFSSPNGEGMGKGSSKIVIKKPGKKTLIIENGEVIEGGDDYTPEEIEQIKKNNQIQWGSGDMLGKFNFDDKNLNDLLKPNESMKEQFDRLQKEMDSMRKRLDEPQEESEKQNFNKEEKSGNAVDKTTEEMLKAKEEMLKAKSELEKAKKELQKAKTELKTQRI